MVDLLVSAIIPSAILMKLSGGDKLGATFFSAVMNYLTANWVVTSPVGSAAFNEELGLMTLLSYPVITIHDMTGLKFKEILITKKSIEKRNHASD
jgi:hypothetical protein